MSVRVLIVDDEPLSRLGVTARLERHPDMEIVGECATGKEALRLIPRIAPDVIFLDIEMPDISGLELLERLPKEKAPCIVFLTAHEEFALNAFDLEALDYLLKPVDEARFGACLERVRRMLSLYQRELLLDRMYGAVDDRGSIRDEDTITRFAVRRGNEVAFVQSADIDWIEGLGNYIGLHVKDKTHLVRLALSSLESRLEAKQFVRIHRSTIVQIDRIIRVQPLSNRDAIVTLRDGKALRASRTYRDSLQAILCN
jgi:two-component system LytT family response regulator